MAISCLNEPSSDLQVMRIAINFLDEFDFETDQTIHMRVTCPLVSHRPVMGESIARMITTSFFIGSSSNLQITKIGIKSRTSLILALFRLLALELPALESLIDLGKCCQDNSDFIFD